MPLLLVIVVVIGAAELSAGLSWRRMAMPPALTVREFRTEGSLRAGDSPQSSGPSEQAIGWMP